jgi:hypothetical protein
VARNSAALVVALVLIVGGVATGLQLTPSPAPSPDETRGPPTPSSTEAEPSPTVAEPSPTETLPSGGGGTGTGPLPVMLFLDGVIYRYLNGTKGLAAVPVGSIPEKTAVQPPVAIKEGVLVLGGQAGHETNLWLVPDGGNRTRIASNVGGFALSADGQRLAYSELLDGSRRSRLTEVHLRILEPAITLEVDTNASVVGYVGDDVVLDTGDGAGVQAQTWRPGDDAIHPINGFTSPIATDPQSGFAVMVRGDGGCWSIVNLLDPNIAEETLNDCWIRGVSFEPGGSTLAGIEFRRPTERFLLVGTTSNLGGEAELDGGLQTYWTQSSRHGPGQIMVMAEPTPGKLMVRTCQVSENLCSELPVWTGTSTGEQGSAWIVERG